MSPVAIERGMSDENKAGKKPARPQTTLRFYVEQAEKFNELARTLGVSVAEAVELRFDTLLDRMLIELTEEKLKRLRKK